MKLYMESFIYKYISIYDTKYLLLVTRKDSYWYIFTLMIENLDLSKV